MEMHNPARPGQVLREYLPEGLSDDEEPDLWQKHLTGAIQLWIMLACRLKKIFSKLAENQPKWR